MHGTWSLTYQNEEESDNIPFWTQFLAKDFIHLNDGRKFRRDLDRSIKAGMELGCC